MPLTQKDRMKKLMDAMNWDQSKLGEILGMTQQGAGKIARGETKLKDKHALKLQLETGFQINWLLRGIGPMTDEPDIVSEPAAVHMTRTQADISPESMQVRFTEAFENYKEYHNLTTYAEACEALKLNPEHVNNVRKKRKAVTITQLACCLRYGKINSNYILGGQLPILIRNANDSNSEIELLCKRIEELESDKRMLTSHIQLLQNSISTPELKQQTG